MTSKSRKTKEAARDLPCCAVCEYFTADPQDDDGDCRRHPPIAIFDGSKGGFMFPTVDVDTWCGEFRRRVS